MMKYCICSGACGDLHTKMAALTVPLMEKYAAKHGCDFSFLEIKPADRPPAWYKLKLVEKLLSDYNAVLWIDTDVVIVNGNEDIFNHFSKNSIQGLVEHKTREGLVPNTGVWITTKGILPYIEEAWNQVEFINHPWWEQAAFMKLMGYSIPQKPITHLVETPLYKLTHFMNNEWNRHPYDISSATHTNFKHISWGVGYKPVERLQVIESECKGSNLL